MNSGAESLSAHHTAGQTVSNNTPQATVKRRSERMRSILHHPHIGAEPHCPHCLQRQRPQSRVVRLCRSHCEFRAGAPEIVSSGFPMTPRARSPLRAVAASVAFTAVLSLPKMIHAQSIQLAPGKMPAIGTVDERYQSYNIEMLEVTGGRFWAPYKAQPAAPTDTAQPAPGGMRSEERRVGKECRSQWSPEH